MLSPDLNKSLPLMILPLGLSLILLTAALRWTRRALIILPLIILGFLSTPAIANLLMASLENRFPYRSVADCPSADAVFVFGGMLGPRDRTDGSVAWNEAAERFERAARLMQGGKARTLVFSGGPTRYPSGGDEGDLLKQQAIAQGISEDTILVTASTRNTKAEAADLCRLAQSMRWQRVLLVTSAYHMRRVMRLTNPCTAERIPVPVAYRTPDPRTSWAYHRLENYLPQAEALLTSELALREYLGTLLIPARAR